MPMRTGRRVWGGGGLYAGGKAGIESDMGKRLRNEMDRLRFSAHQVHFMAKTSWIEREKKKAATVAKYAAMRAELKAKGDYVGLSLLPRNASPVRMSKRCLQSGRKRAFIGRFKLSRIAFRELASHGMIPGVTKSSW
jgi:small subunit ribosomal protein S14